MSTLAPGDVYDKRYRIVEPLGEPGGFGEVFLVEDMFFEGWPREALKRLRFGLDPTGTIGRYIDEEIVTMKKLSIGHRGIPTINIYSRGPEGEPYFTMEYVEGSTLRDLLKSDVPFEEARVLRLLQDILEVLEFVHALGYTHRDLKPGNVIVTAPGTPNEQAKVIDFGIASIKKKVGTLAGTPGYMDPGQVSQDEVDPAMDLFALGVIAAKMMARIPEPSVPKAQLANPEWARRDLEARVQGFVQAFQEAAQASDATKRLVLSLLDLDRARRPTARTALRKVAKLRAPNPQYSPRWIAVTLAAVMAIATLGWFGRCWLGRCAPQEFQLRVVDESGTPAAGLAVFALESADILAVTDSVGIARWAMVGDLAAVRLVDRRAVPGYKLQESYPLASVAAESIVILRVETARAPAGWLQIGSDPKGVRVRVDGQSSAGANRTPLNLGPLAPGRTKIEFAFGGFEDRDTTVVVAANDTAIIFMRLARCRRYEIRTFPAGAVYVDGGGPNLTNDFGIGRTPPLCPGEHVFRVVSQTGQESKLRYPVRPGDPCTELVLDTTLKVVRCLK